MGADDCFIYQARAACLVNIAAKYVMMVFLCDNVRLFIDKLHRDSLIGSTSSATEIVTYDLRYRDQDIITTCGV